MINWMTTGNYLVVHYGANRPCILEKGTPKYATVLSLLVNGAQEDVVVNELDITQQIQEYGQNMLDIEPNSGTVAIDNKVVHGVIVDRIVEFYKQKLPYLPLVNFWRNIQENPSDESKEHLYLFLEANKMPITHDGCFLAYKGVSKNDEGDLVDTHTKTISNNIGSVVTMDRKKVDPNRQQTCSSGLHVASYVYAAHTYGGDAILEVKINPRDVVAVPDDYNNQKMRVCRYEVVSVNKKGEIQDSYIPDDNDERVDGSDEIQDEIPVNKDDVLQNLMDAPKGSTIQITDLLILTGRQILDMIKHKTGLTVDIDLKNKKSIVNKAKKLLVEYNYQVV